MMPSSSARSFLSNCYTPCAVPEENETNNDSLQRDNGDGLPRTAKTLRRVCLETSILSGGMMGSSLVELGHTKVLAQAKLLSNSNEVQVDTGVLQINCQAVAHFGMPSAPTVQSLDGRAPSSNSTSRDQVAYLQGQLYTAMVPAIRNLQDYHKIVISVDITILQNDGALLTACCAAATLALCDAGVELYDLVTCGQVVVLKDIILADPTLEEEQEASSRLVLALCHNDVTFWRQSGVIPPEAMETCQEACRTLHLLLRNHLIQKINGHVTRKESQ